MGEKIKEKVKGFMKKVWRSDNCILPAILYNEDFYLKTEDKIVPLYITNKVSEPLNKHNLALYVFRNYEVHKNEYYLIDKNLNIKAHSLSAFSFENTYWKSEKTIISDKTSEIIDNVIYVYKDIFYVCEDEEYAYPASNKIHNEYKEAMLLDAKSKIPTGSTGVISKDSNNNIKVTKHAQKKFKTWNNKTFYSCQVTPNLYINIKDNQVALLRKFHNLKEVVVNYGVYEDILPISDEFLLVCKRNDSGLNDEISAHWPKKPIFIYSVIDKAGKNVLDGAYFRKIELIDENIVRLYSGSSLEKYKDFDVVNQKTVNYVNNSPDFSFLNFEVGPYHNETPRYSDSIFAPDIGKDIGAGFLVEGSCLIDTEKKCQLSEVFDFTEYFDKETFIIHINDSYKFLDASGRIYNTKSYEDEYQIKIIDDYWILYKNNIRLTPETDLYECIYPYDKNNELFIVKFCNFYGFIDSLGQKIVPCIYSTLGKFQGEYIYAEKENEDKYYILSNKGEIIYSTNKPIDSEIIQTDKIIIISGEKCIYELNGEKVIMNHLTEKDVQKYKQKYKDFKFLYSSVYEIYDKKTKQLITMYPEISQFSHNLASVFNGDKWGYINEAAEEILPCIYDEANDFEDDFAVVNINRRYHIINKQGIIIL